MQRMIGLFVLSMLLVGLSRLQLFVLSPSRRLRDTSQRRQRRRDDDQPYYYDGGHGEQGQGRERDGPGLR